MYFGIHMEKDDLTMQTSIHLVYDGGEVYEKHVLFQLRTADTMKEHLMKYGTPH